MITKIKSYKNSNSKSLSKSEFKTNKEIIFENKSLNIKSKKKDKKDKKKKSKHNHNYNDYELNWLSYKKATKYDKRSYFKII